VSDFLTLSQDLHREVGAAGVAPTSVLNQTGENARLVNWIKQADYKLQTKWINWKFLRQTFNTSNQTAQGTATLAKPADLKTWDLATFTVIYPGETEKSPVEVIEYESIKSQILDTNEGPVQSIIIMPDNSLMFNPVPDGIYTINADYYLKPVKLAANIDVSLIPEEYHDTAVLGRAMMYYANFENASEIRQQGLELFTEGLAEMENHQLPNQNYSRLRTGGGFEVVAGQFADSDSDLGW
jgi:hypothetical protein